MYTTMGTLSGEHTRKHAHDAAGECQLHDDEIEVEVHQTKLLCVKDGGRMHVIAEEEGDGEARTHSQQKAGDEVEVHPNRVKPALGVNRTCSRHLIRQDLRNDQKGIPFFGGIDRHSPTNSARKT